ncbi:MAG TPA: DUF1566 domain-containing protein, partial [Cellvibrionaceae bacterium]|nr:DUF1566 domain-containing protein [Cellvibrionaceae bacterium]
APLNDTGVSQCRSADELTKCPQNNNARQDAEQGRDAEALAGRLSKVGGGVAGFDFTKLAMNGLPLARQNQTWQVNGSESAGTRWFCVKDNHTGLIWEVKSNTEGDLHYSGDTFSWYNPDTKINAGNPGGQNLGFCHQAPCDTWGFIARVNSEKLCGRSNWRLPTAVELLSIIDQSQINPPVDTQYFPNLSFNAHWSSQTHAERLNAAWYVYFTAGDNGAIAKTSVANALLVSGGEE